MNQFADIPSQSARTLHGACYFAIFCVGLYATSFGPALPFLARRLDISLDGAGLLLTAIFSGSIVASASMTFGLTGGRTRMAVALGMAGGAVGLLVLGVVQNWWAALAAAGLLGLGDGLVVAGAHVLIANTSNDVAAGITRLNLWFAVGAIAGPLWAGAVLASNASVPLLYAGLGLVMASGMVLLWWARDTAEHRDRGDGSAGRGPALSGFVVLTGVLLLVYVGAEIGLGSWVSSYAERTAGAGIFAAAAITSGYWAALALGRIIAARLFSHGWTASTVLRISIVGGLLASLALVALGANVWLGAAAAFATGLCFGPIWPSAMAAATAGGEQNVPAAMVTLGNAGGVVFPWAQGVVLVSQGARTGVAVTVALCVIMLALSLVSSRLRVPGMNPAVPPSPTP